MDNKIRCKNCLWHGKRRCPYSSVDEEYNEESIKVISAGVTDDNLCCNLFVMKPSLEQDDAVKERYMNDYFNQ